MSFALVLTLTAALPAHAQKFQPKSIQFTGDPEYSHEEMMAAAGLKAGETLTYADMNDVSKKLMATGVFASLLFKFDGQDLVFQLTPEDPLYPVRIVNLPLTPGKDLDAKLHAALPLYHGKVPAEGGLNEQVRAALEQMLTTQGLKARVVATPGTNGGAHGAGWIGYSITLPQVRPDVTKLDGVSASLADGVQQVLKDAEKDAYDTSATEQNLVQAIALFYQDRGYPAVKVEAARAGAPTEAFEAIRIPFSVAVDEGRFYKLGTVTVPAGSPLTQADADKLLTNKGMHLQPGEKLRGLLGAVKTGYGTKGYLDCKVALKPSYDEAADTVNYTITAEPGPVFHLAYVKFENVGDNLRRVLMRNWPMMPGDAFNEPFAADYLLHLTAADPKLGEALRGTVEMMSTTTDQQTHDVNVVIRIEKP
ncbi:MAG TPA: hypothetical protein VMV57_01535 [Terracidiphilus sp.]|nr:hypothetical protein [Terracidiphilus sp.]